MRVAILVLLLCCLTVSVCPAFWRTLEAHAAGVEHSGLLRQAREVLADALAAQEKGDTAQARRLLEAYVAAHPGDPDTGAPAVAHLLLGNVLFESGDVRAAVAAYTAGLAVHGDDPGLCRNLAVARSELGEYALAAALFERAYTLDPEHGPELLYQAAAGRFRADQPGLAVEVLDRLLAAVPVPEERWLELMAHCCLESGNTARAQSVLEDLVARFPTAPRHWRSLAGVRLRREDHVGAAAALEVCTRLAPAPIGELEELASVYLYLAAPLRAVETLLRAYGEQPDRPEALDRLFDAYARAQRPESALAALDRALELAPSVERFKRKGRFLFENGRYADALIAYSRVLELAPADADVAMWAGYSALELDDLEAARTFFNRAARDASARPRAESCLRYVTGLAKARREAASGETPAAPVSMVSGI